MATTKKKPTKRPAAKSKSVSSKVEPAVKPTAAEKLLWKTSGEAQWNPYRMNEMPDDDIRDLLTQFDDRANIIGDRERELELMKANLATLQSRIESAIAAMRKVASTLWNEPQIYDDDLRKELGKVETHKQTYSRAKKKSVKLATGAVPWGTLQKTGATDAQIIKNIDNACYFGSFTRFDVDKEKGVLRIVEAHRFFDDLVIRVTGNDEVIKEVRRIFEIPQPIAGAAKEPAGTSTKKKAKNRPPKKTVKTPAKKAARTNVRSKAKSRPASNTPTGTIAGAKPAARSKAVVKKEESNAANRPGLRLSGDATKKTQGALSPGLRVAANSANARKTASNTPRDPDRDPASGVSPADWAEAQELIKAKPDQYKNLQKKLKKKTLSTTVILKHLRDSAMPKALADAAIAEVESRGATDAIVELATGRRPPKGKHSRDEDPREPRDDRPEAVNRDVHLPDLGAGGQGSGNGQSPRTVDIRTPPAGKKNVAVKPHRRASAEERRSLAAQR